MASPPLNRDEMAVRAALDEVAFIAKALESQNRVMEALDVLLRGLEIRKRYYGVGSEEFETGRVEAAAMVLHAVEIHSAQEKHKEAADLLVHVDKLTVYPLPSFPRLNRKRLLIRANMLKQLMIVRHRQQRFRSALTFGRHMLDLVERLCCVCEWPAAHLNLASTYSALNLHEDALGHCYIAYQCVGRILNACESPQTFPFTTAAMLMEQADKACDDVKSFELFEQCLQIRTENPDSHEFAESVAADCPVPQYSVEIPEEEQISSLRYLLWAGNAKASNKRSLFPCVELLANMQQASNPMPRHSEQRQRWGGVLALVYRAIAVEQEHLNQIAGALLTYRVAHTTALQCLGESHPVTLQCHSALTDAEECARKKEVAQRAFSRAHKSLSRAAEFDASRRQNAKSATKPRRLSPIRMTRNTTSTSPTRTSQKMQSDEREEKMSRTMPLHRHGRPEWDPWFNSKELPVSRIPLKPQTAPSGDFDETLLGALPSTIIRQSTSDAHTPPRAAKSKRAKAPSPAAPEAAREPYETTEELEEISPADFAFLQQTFKLRYDAAFSRPAKRVAPMRREQHERRALEAEKALAKAIAVEEGINTDE